MGISCMCDSYKNILLIMSYEKYKVGYVIGFYI